MSRNRCRQICVHMPWYQARPSAPHRYFSARGHKGGSPRPHFYCIQFGGRSLTVGGRLQSRVSYEKLNGFLDPCVATVDVESNFLRHRFNCAGFRNGPSPERVTVGGHQPTEQERLPAACGRFRNSYSCMSCCLEKASWQKLRPVGGRRHL